MKIPPDQNTRAEAMWRIISQRVDFRGKRVVDLGCGTGDFMWRAYVAGASMVDGIDLKNRITLRPVVGIGDEGENDKEIYPPIFFYQGNVEDIIKDPLKNPNIQIGNIALCFSVLPYLDDIPATLKWMSENFELCLIEAQYAPEPYNVGVLSNRGMVQLLVDSGFTDVEPLGYTTVKGRKHHNGVDIRRTIWMCK